jgi:hypothetical protein
MNRLTKVNILRGSFIIDRQVVVKQRANNKKEATMAMQPRIDHAKQEKVFAFHEKLRRASQALWECLVRERRLAELKERYAMNNKEGGVNNDIHR